MNKESNEEILQEKHTEKFFKNQKKEIGRELFNRL